MAAVADSILAIGKRPKRRRKRRWKVSIRAAIRDDGSISELGMPDLAAAAAFEQGRSFDVQTGSEDTL